jgi:quercetin dioxygenase-like cupin family protein
MALDTWATVGSPATSFGPLTVKALTDMAAGLACTADAWADRLPEDPVFRTGLLLLASEDFDAWLLRWPPGTGVAPHDHGDSTGAFTVVTGELLEIRWTRGFRRSRLVSPGEVTTIDRGVVHDVIAPSERSLSVHVYSPPLTSMSFYDEFGQEAVRHMPVEDRSPTLVTTRGPG